MYLCVHMWKKEREIERKKILDEVTVLKCKTSFGIGSRQFSRHAICRVPLLFFLLSFFLNYIFQSTHTGVYILSIFFFFLLFLSYIFENCSCIPKDIPHGPRINVFGASNRAFCLRLKWDDGPMCKEWDD